MKIIYGINKIKAFPRAVVALGVFDGLHRGHCNILKAAVSQAIKIKGTSIVLTFFPHPQLEQSLYSLEHRLKLIAQLGVDVCIVVEFSPSFAKISPTDFIAKILIKKIKAKFIYVGKNFRFGRFARGDYRLLYASAQKYNYQLKIIQVVKSKGLPISSTLIRKLIKNGKIKKAEELLGRRVSILGTVIRGSSLGRALGFPTANINPHHEVIPPAGIYAVGIILGNKKYKGICYIGRRPTIPGHNNNLRIEVHIFNFHKDLYGKSLEIKFVKLIRQDQKFACLSDLRAQIQKDIISCRKFFASIS